MKAGRLVWGVSCITLINSLVDRLPEGREFSCLLFLFGAVYHLELEKHPDPLNEDRAYPVVDDEGSRHGPPVKLWSGVGQVLKDRCYTHQNGHRFPYCLTILCAFGRRPLLSSLDMRLALLGLNLYAILLKQGWKQGERNDHIPYLCDDPAPAGPGSGVAARSGDTDGDIDYITVVVAGWSVA
jgi:hypothetical protein